MSNERGDLKYNFDLGRTEDFDEEINLDYDLDLSMTDGGNDDIPLNINIEDDNLGVNFDDEFDITSVLNCYWESITDSNGDVFTEALKPRVKEGDAGIDLRAKETVVLNPGEDKTIDTGFYLEIPFGYFGMLVPRSSMGKKGLRLRNTVGIVDFGYHDSVKALVRNEGNEKIVIEQTERFCQLILIPHLVISDLNFKEKFDSENNRGGGFGSTGKK